MGMMPRHAARSRRRHLQPRALRVRLAYGFVSLDVAERAARQGRSRSCIQLRVDDIYEAPRDRRRHPEQLGAEYVAQDWADMNQSLFSALWLEKMAISITIGLIVMVAALNIVASLILLVMEKSRDIAILKTMGSQRAAASCDLHAAGADHRRGRHDGRRRSAAYALCCVLDRYQLIQDPGRRLPGLVRAVRRPAARLRAGRGRRAVADLLRRDDLSVAAGGAARSGAGQVDMP